MYIGKRGFKTGKKCLESQEGLKRWRLDLLETYCTSCTLESQEGLKLNMALYGAVVCNYSTRISRRVETHRPGASLCAVRREPLESQEGLKPTILGDSHGHSV